MKRFKGFTLLEVMVVLAIIGVLAGLVLFGISAAQRNARDVERQTFVRDLHAGMIDLNLRTGRTAQCIVFHPNYVIFKQTTGGCGTTQCPNGSSNCAQFNTDGVTSIGVNSSSAGGLNWGPRVSPGTTTNSSSKYCIKLNNDGYVFSVDLENGEKFVTGDSLDLTCP